MINKNDVLDILKSVVADKRVQTATEEFKDGGWKFAAVGFGVGVVATSVVCAINKARVKKAKKELVKEIEELEEEIDKLTTAE